MYTDFEQDLILACKNWYGENGIEKVIRDYIGYAENQEITIDSKYHFISELYDKLCNNGHLKLTCLLYRLSPRRIYDHKNRSLFNNLKYSLYDFPNIVCDHMVGEIQGMRIKDDNSTLIEIHEAKDKFIDKEDVEK